MSDPWTPFREGTNGPDDQWPHEDVYAVVNHYAESRGHTTIWWGIRQVIDALLVENEDLADGWAKAEAQHDETNRFHRDRVEEADKEVLRLKVKVDMLRRQLEAAESRQP